MLEESAPQGQTRRRKRTQGWSVFRRQFVPHRGFLRWFSEEAGCIGGRYSANPGGRRPK